MSDEELRAYLSRLDLDDYADAFVVERIDLRDLPFLSDADLVALGLPLGPRRRLLQAAHEAAALPRPEGERRNLTVLFCDMVDSTALATHLDPEDLRALYRAFGEACVAAIEAERGYVAHRLGDGLMAHFGFPRAMEDAAIRAVRAGLGIVARVGRLEKVGETAVTVRVGIASGLTVIEDLRAGLVSEDEAVTGATLSLAARLQALAPPGGVVISDATRLLLRGAFDLMPLGSPVLKGFPQKQAVWQVRAPAADPPSQGPHSAGKLVGRDGEMALLRSCWQACRGGEGGIVTVRGEGGIGKSRLLAALVEHVDGTGEVVSLACSRYRQDAAFHPVADWLGARLGQAGSGSVRDRLARLPGVSTETAPLLESIAGTGRAADVSDDEALRRQDAIIDAVVDLLAPPGAGARLVVVEDAHWADPATLDVLDRLAGRGSEQPVLLVIAARPDAVRLPGGPNLRQIELAPLSADATLQLVAELSPDLPDTLRRTIVERSGGFPLFTEELTRSLLETPEADAADVPITLQDTLMARLDRLRAGKPVAQIGALIGRSFSWRLLVACADLAEDALREGLQELVSASLVERRSAEDYAFRHALVRDAAYGSLLRSRRVLLHGRVAQTIEAKLPDIAEAQPERLARHCTEAGQIEAAVGYWERAAERSIAQAAPSTAMSCFTSAIDLLARLPLSAARDRKEVELRLRLNMPLTVLHGFASTATEQNLTRMAALLEGAEASEAALQLLWSRCMSALVRSDLDTARKTALQLQGAAQRAPLPNAHRMPHRMLGYVAMLEGKLDLAEAHFTQVLDGYRPEHLDPIMPGHPFDVMASTLAQHAILMALRDRPVAVEADQHRALSRARQLSSPATSFQVLVHLCFARFELDDHDKVLPLLAELRDLVDLNEIAPLYADLWEGWQRARSGDLDAGLADMHRARSSRRTYPLWLPRTWLLEADLLLEAGRVEEALSCLDSCDDEIARLQHSYLLAETARRRAACLAALGGEAEDVEALLAKAIHISRGQGTRRFEAAARRDLDDWQRSRTRWQGGSDPRRAGT